MSNILVIEDHTVVDLDKITMVRKHGDILSFFFDQEIVAVDVLPENIDAIWLKICQPNLRDRPL